VGRKLQRQLAGAKVQQLVENHGVRPGPHRLDLDAA
jgi:hypothetical protein